jgi:hypothetical protein
MEYHLNDLRKALENERWVLTDVLEGNGYDISGVWQLERYGEKIEIHFDGQDDLKVLPMEKAFGCSAIPYLDVSLYFAPRNKSWNKLLQLFISKIESLSTNGC